MLGKIGKRVFRDFKTMIRNNIENNQTRLSSSTTTCASLSKDPMSSRIVWMDLEMTGLNVDTDKIMEIACSITDYNLELVATGPSIIVHQPDEVLLRMEEWCTNTHNLNGLTEACRQSTTTIEQAEEVIMSFLSEHVAPNKATLAGNSVYMDRFFLMKHMPKIHHYLHHRIIDVSTIKELCRSWNKEVFKNQPDKRLGHRATDDIAESIEELRYYRKSFFKEAQSHKN